MSSEKQGIPNAWEGHQKVIGDLHQTVNRLNADLSAEKRAHQLTAELVSKQHDQSARLDEQRTTIVSQGNELVAKDARIAELEAENKSLLENQSRLEESITSLLAQIVALKQQLADAQGQAKDWRNSTIRHNAVLGSLATKHGGDPDQHESPIAFIEQQLQELSTARETNEKLTADLSLLSGSDFNAVSTALADAVAKRITVLSEKLAAAEKDSERYQAMRVMTYTQLTEIVDSVAFICDVEGVWDDDVSAPEEFDEKVDAAIRSQGEG